MRRITAAIGALALTAGVLLGVTGTASAQQESVPPASCLGATILLATATDMCIINREGFPVFLWW
jgi:hypothetical protein